MNQNDDYGPVLDFEKLHQSLTPLVAVLLGCTVVAAIWGGWPGGPVGAGVLALAGGTWGIMFGFVGLKRSLKKGIAENNVTLLAGDHPLTRETHRLCARLGMSARPLVGTMPAFNAYAIGSSPENSMVVIGTPLLEQLTSEEVSAVIAHELGHIANNDMRRMGLARSFQKSLTWYLGKLERLQRAARWAFAWAGELAILRLSRKREYWADAIGATLVSPEAMRGALRKVCAAPAPLTPYESANARLMFRGKGSSVLSTHPTLADRENALREGTYLRRLPVLRPALPAPSRPTLQVAGPAVAAGTATDLAY